MLAALAEGASEITHFSAAADCRSTLDCFSRLGVKVDIQGDRVRITGLGLEGLRRPRRTLDAGNSGTTMRLLAGILAGQEFRSTIDGDASLRQPSDAPRDGPADANGRADPRARRRLCAA